MLNLPKLPGSTRESYLQTIIVRFSAVLHDRCSDKTAQSPAQVESPASATVPRPNQDKWAVVVGLSRFRDPLNKCQYGSQDAQDFTNYLVHDAHFAKDHVHTLIDTQATRDNVMRELGEVFLPQVTKPDDLVLDQKKATI